MTDLNVRAISTDDEGNYVGPGKHQFSRFSGSGAMDEDLNLAANSSILAVKFHCAPDISAAEYFIASDAADGVGAGQQFINQVMDGEHDFMETYSQLSFEGGSIINFAFTNTDAVTWALEVVWRIEG